MKTIGEVIDALKDASPSLPVWFAFGGIAPTTVDSWRGIYAEAALGFNDGSYGASGITVEGLLKELNNAIDGRYYTGWKGGDYTYHLSTPLHIDNPGNSTNTEIDRIEVSEYEVIIHTVRESS